MQSQTNARRAWRDAALQFAPKRVGSHRDANGGGYRERARVRTAEAPVRRSGLHLADALAVDLKVKPILTQIRGRLPRAFGWFPLHLTCLVCVHNAVVPVLAFAGTVARRPLVVSGSISGQWPRAKERDNAQARRSSRRSSA